MINELSIIIPTLNEEAYLPRLLESIVQPDFKGKLEVLVVDGGSKDMTLQKAHAFDKGIDIKILKTHKGLSYQRNLGAEHAKYKYLLFLDADVILSSGVLKNISKLNPNPLFVASPVFLPYDGDIVDTIVFFGAYVVLATVSLFRPVTSGGFLLTSKENHIRIVGFGSDIILGEDADYGDRSRHKGAIFYHLPFFVWHSSRRARSMGKIRMVVTYVKMYAYYLRFGPIKDADRFEYPYGEYLSKSRAMK